MELLAQMKANIEELPFNAETLRAVEDAIASL